MLSMIKDRSYSIVIKSETKSLLGNSLYFYIKYEVLRPFLTFLRYRFSSSSFVSYFFVFSFTFSSALETSVNYAFLLSFC
jgi:hypothetical protein